MNIPTEEQQKVIDLCDCDILLQAPAGTGKTFTIARKILNEIVSGRCSRVLCLTFTKRAAQEMSEELGQNAYGARIDILTIHGFCYRLLKECAKELGLPAEPVICDEIDAESILKKRVLKEMNDLYGLDRLKKAGIESITGASIVKSVSGQWYHHIAGKDGGVLIGRGGERYAYGEVPLCNTFSCPFCGEEISECESCPHCKGNFDEYVLPTVDTKINLYALVSRVRHYREFYEIRSESEKKDYRETYRRLLTDQPYETMKLFSVGYTQDPFEAYAPAWIGALTARYTEELRACGLVDFDDLLMIALRALSDPDICARYRDAIDFLVVDEIQDTSRLEYSVVEKLFGQNRVMFCGDVEQSIYAWRGAEPLRVLEHFRKARNPAELFLTANLRASPALANAASSFMTGTAACDETETAPIELHESFNAESQVEYVYHCLRALPECERSRCCVMARNNRSLETFFEDVQSFCSDDERPVRFTKNDEETDFYKNATAKDFLSVFRLLINPFDSDALNRFAANRLGLTGHALNGIRKMRRCGLDSTDLLDGEGTDPYAALFDSLDRGACVVFDLETTGLDITTDQPIQIAAVKIDAAGIVKDRYESLVRTDVAMGRGAIETHGITSEKLKESGRDRKEALSEFAAFCDGCVTVGYNSAAFDLGMITLDCMRCGISFRPGSHFDAMIIAKRLYQDLPNYKLATLCDYFEVKNEQAHDAMSDVVATATVLCRMAERLRADAALRSRYITNKPFPNLRAFGADLKRWRARVFASDSESVTKEIRDRWFACEKDGEAVATVFCRLLTATEPMYVMIRKLLQRSLDGDTLWKTVMGTDHAVRLTTVHQAKGCEFDTVFLIDADSEHFPNWRSVKENGERGRAEERRIFYVALTRAKSRLVAVYSATRFNAATGKRWHIAPSPFFNEIPAKYIIRT